MKKADNPTIYKGLLLDSCGSASWVTNMSHCNHYYFFFLWNSGTQPPELACPLISHPIFVEQSIEDGFSSWWNIRNIPCINIRPFLEFLHKYLIFFTNILFPSHKYFKIYVLTRGGRHPSTHRSMRSRAIDDTEKVSTWMRRETSALTTSCSVATPTTTRRQTVMSCSINAKWSSRHPMTWP